jgi:predicted ATPase
MSTRGISDLERGARRWPYRHTIAQLADALQLDNTARAALEQAAARADEGDRRTRSGGAEPASVQQVVGQPTIPHNLRAPPTPLVGRSEEVAAVCALLRRDSVRLLTLHGPAGVGKTRLALEVARELLADFPDGVFVVPLARLNHPDWVASAIAEALGLRERGDRSPERALQSHLEGKRLLLLLDNFEHLVAAASLLADLLATCHALKILVTSRAVVRVRGEQAFPVLPLALPNLVPLPPLDVLAQVPAVDLFVQRVQAVMPDFQLTQAKAPAIAAICHRLDGLPLALELAAARTTVLPPQELLARLERRLPLLAGGVRDLPERQQTMRRTLQWSYDLLDLSEQALFRRLSVFSGGCTFEAAEAVCRAVAEPTVDVLNGLASLVDKNLLRREVGARGELRVSMLQTVREFGWEELVGSGEARLTQDAHARYYLHLAEEAEPQLTGPEQGLWLERLELEHANLRTALGWAKESEETDLGLRLAAALWRFWYMCDHPSEGRRWLEGFLAGSQAAAPELRGQALYGAGVLAFQQGELERAAALSEESLAILRALGDRHRIAAVLNSLGNVVREQGDYQRAAALYGESLTLRWELGDTRGVAVALNNLGTTARYQGDYGRAVALHEESLALRRELGDSWGIANILQNLGEAVYEKGDLERAAALVEESLARRRELGDKHGVALSLSLLGRIAQRRGDLTCAEERLEESLALCRELGESWGVAIGLFHLGQIAHDRQDYGRAADLFAECMELHTMVGHQRDIALCLEGLARIACSHGRFERAARLLGAAHGVRERLRAPLPPAETASVAETAAAAREALGTETFERACRDGAALPLEQAMAEALEAALIERAGISSGLQ